MATLTRTRLAEALFVSALEPADTPTRAAVRAAIDTAIQRYGAQGCAAQMATRFGDQPDLAVRRMIWVNRVIDTVELTAA